MVRTAERPRRAGRGCVVSEWQPIQSAPEGVKIETRIRDIHGIRNEQRLVRKGRLWFLPDMSMYVYYTPTEWRPLEASHE